MLDTSLNTSLNPGSGPNGDASLANGRKYREGEVGGPNGAASLADRPAARPGRLGGPRGGSFIGVKEKKKDYSCKTGVHSRTEDQPASL